MPLSAVRLWMIKPRFKAGAFFIPAVEAFKPVVERLGKSAIIQGINAAQGIPVAYSDDVWPDQGIGQISVIKQ